MFLKRDKWLRNPLIPKRYLPMDTMEKEVELPKRIKLLFSFLVLIAGLGLYLYWAASYNAWTDIGLYSISVPIIGFGLVGVFLFTRKEIEE